MLATRFPLVLALLALPALARGTGHTSDSLTQIKKNVDAKKAVLVDVREPAEWNRGHLKGAIFLPLSTLQQWQNGELDTAKRDELLRSLPKELVLYCHCAAGGRALIAGDILKARLRSPTPQARLQTARRSRFHPRSRNQELKINHARQPLETRVAV